MKESLGIRKIIQNVSIYIFYFSFDPFPCLYLGIIIPVYFVFSCFLPCSSFPNLVLKKKITLKINEMLVHYYGEGHGSLLQYSCLENPVGGGAL